MSEAGMRGIAQAAAEFTRLHVEKALKKGEGHPASFFFAHGLKGPRLDIPAYADAFSEGVMPSSTRGPAGSRRRTSPGRLPG